MTEVKDGPQPMNDLLNDLSEALLSVGEAKLGIQAATSIGYDTQALGLMAGKRVLVTRATALIGLAFALLGIAQLAPVFYDLATRMST